MRLTVVRRPDRVLMECTSLFLLSFFFKMVNHGFLPVVVSVTKVGWLQSQKIFLAS